MVGHAPHSCYVLAGCTYMCSKCLTKCFYACHLLKNTETATVPLISNDSY